MVQAIKGIGVIGPRGHLQTDAGIRTYTTIVLKHVPVLALLNVNVSFAETS